MGGNTGNMGSASPSGSGSAAPSGGKGAASPVQPYQGGQQTAQNMQASNPMSNYEDGAFGGAFGGMGQGPTQQMQQQNTGSFGFGQTAQSNQQYSQSPQQSGIQGLQGLLGGYGKGGGGSMPNPYQQTQQQGGMPIQQQHNPASDDGMVGLGYQQLTQPQTAATTPSFYGQQPTQPDIQTYTDNDHMAGSIKGIGGYGDNDQMGGVPLFSSQPVQQNQQTPVQQPSNMFYNMSAADIDKFNSQPRGQSALAAPAALDSGMVGRNQQVLTPEQTAAMQQASRKKGGPVK